MNKKNLIEVTKKIIAEDNHDLSYYPDSLIDKIADAALAFGVTEKTTEDVIRDLVTLASDEMTDPKCWTVKEADDKSEFTEIIYVRPELPPVYVALSYSEEKKEFTIMKATCENRNILHNVLITIHRISPDTVSEVKVKR